MTAFYALLGALIVGGSDFAGGVVSRTVSAFRVTVWAQAASLAALFVAVWFVDAPHVTSTDLVAGVVAGLSATFSFVALYSAFARGQISRLAPTAAIVGAVVPTAVGAARGDSIDALQLVGMVLALVAIIFVTQERAKAGGPGSTPPLAFALALIAGSGFSIFFLSLAETSEDAGFWPLVVARLTSVPAVAITAVAVSGGLMIYGRDRRILVAAGLAEAISNVFVLWAYQRGPLAVAAVLGAFYPVSTVLLAGLVLRERLQRIQMFGVGLALASVPLIAVS